MLGINEAGKRLLKNLEHTARQIKGTMEVRKMMRYETNAGRARRGVPICVTWSPDEEHNVLMLRLHRSRANDPIHELDKDNQKFGTRAMPNMDQDYVEMKVSKPPPRRDLEQTKQDVLLVVVRVLPGVGCL